MKITSFDQAMLMILQLHISVDLHNDIQVNSNQKIKGQGKAFSSVDEIQNYTTKKYIGYCSSKKKT